MTRSIWFVADDFGLSPAVDRGILDLLRAGRLSGTGCMTLFPEWEVEARKLAEIPASSSIGIHITLTDQKSLAGVSKLSPSGKLPSLRALVGAIASGRIDDASIHAEIAAQYDAFRQSVGREPDYLDGHQHVHFLPPVRRWLKKLATSHAGPLPWLRGAPEAARLATGSFAKIATVRALARRFEPALRSAGFAVKGPLSGFYDWKRPDGFEPAVRTGLAGLPDGSVFMCHPGHVDALLAQRDPLTAAREAEVRFLGSDAFRALLDTHQVRIAAT